MTFLVLYFDSAGVDIFWWKDSKLISEMENEIWKKGGDNAECTSDQI